MQWVERKWQDVDSVILRSEENYERRQKLRQRGYDLDRIARKVAEVLGLRQKDDRTEK